MPFKKERATCIILQVHVADSCFVFSVFIWKMYPRNFRRKLRMPVVRFKKVSTYLAPPKCTNFAIFFLQNYVLNINIFNEKMTLFVQKVHKKILTRSTNIRHAFFALIEERTYGKFYVYYTSGPAGHPCSEPSSPQQFTTNSQISLCVLSTFSPTTFFTGHRGRKNNSVFRNHENTNMFTVGFFFVQTCATRFARARPKFFWGQNFAKKC